MANYFIVSKNATSLQAVTTELKLAVEVRAFHTHEIVSYLSRNDAQRLFTVCEVNKVSLYSGKPKANSGNLILSIF